MPRALPLATREVVVARHQAGESLPQLAAALGVLWATVRRVWRRYRTRREAGLVPGDAACGRHGARYTAAQAQALSLRREHPGWGAGLIRVLLAETFPDHVLPHERTLRRWFREASLGPFPRPRPPAPPRRQHPSSGRHPSPALLPQPRAELAFPQGSNTTAGNTGVAPTGYRRMPVPPVPGVILT